MNTSPKASEFLDFDLASEIWLSMLRDSENYALIYENRNWNPDLS